MSWGFTGVEGGGLDSFKRLNIVFTSPGRRKTAYTMETGGGPDRWAQVKSLTHSLLRELHTCTGKMQKRLVRNKSWEN